MESYQGLSTTISAIYPLTLWCWSSSSSWWSSPLVVVMITMMAPSSPYGELSGPINHYIMNVYEYNDDHGDNVDLAVDFCFCFDEFSKLGINKQLRQIVFWVGFFETVDWGSGDLLLMPMQMLMPILIVILVLMQMIMLMLMLVVMLMMMTRALLAE